MLGRAVSISLLLAGVSFGDELVLTDGKTIAWKSLTDKGDVYEVIAADGSKLTVKKSEVERIVIQKPPDPLSGATVKVKAQPPVDLLARIVPKQHALNGFWRISAGALEANGMSDYMYTPVRLEIPYSPPEEYDLQLVVERKDGAETLSIGLVGFGKQFAAVIDAAGGTVSGLSLIDGAGPESNETGAAGKQLAKNKPSTIVCSVRKEKISVTVNGKQIVNWTADYGRLSLPADWSTTNKDRMVLACINSTFKFHKVVLVPYTPAPK